MSSPTRSWRTSFKVAVARALCRPWIGALVGWLTRGIIRTRGLRLNTRSREISNSSRAQLFWGLYETAEFRMVRNGLRPCGTVIDLGCSIGAISSQAAKQLAPGARLIGVEANGALVELARQNIHANAPHVSVEMVHAAVDYTTADAEVTLSRGASHTGSSLAPDPSTDGFAAPAIRLRDLLQSHGVGRYTLIADIEGAEAGIIEMDSNALNTCDQMIVELHSTHFLGRARTPEDLLHQLQDLGFTVDASHGPVHSLSRTNSIRPSGT